MTAESDHSFQGNVAFFERPYPSANAVLLRGPAPILVDPGFGSDVQPLIGWLREQGVAPERLALVVNTHYHSDHVGGNHVLQTDFGAAIAAHTIEADAVNRRDPGACAAVWLRQPVEAYDVGRSLIADDVLDTGETKWQVLHTPGHTRGHVSLYDPVTRALIGGDVVHATDVGWLNPYGEDADSLEQSLDTLDRIAALAPAVILSGHGPAVVDPQAALESARRRLTRWRSDPEGAAWHAAKRIFAYALMIEDGLPTDAVAPYLAASPWVHDLAAIPFSMPADDFATLLVDTMLQSKAIEWRGDRLTARSPHVAPSSGWASSPTEPSAW